ncbi:MAG: hypothetical protein KGY74_05345 [Candidatus Cloacimonetes bacterium]|nr:hypothetical protein [Candidatus Cloacimonadota bacterium]
MPYSRKQIEEVKRIILEKIEEMIYEEYGKITINMNRQAGNIEIVPEPHIKIISKKFDKDE